SAPLLRPETFPTLDDAQIERIRAFGHERALHAGEVLFEQGEPTTKFFVVLEGTLDVVHPYASGEHPIEHSIEHLITIHEVGGFTGEVSVLAGMPSLMRCRARGAGRVLEIDRAALRRLIVTDADLGELLMRAFILRRTGLIAEERGDVVLLGSRHSAAT